jgi:transketolase
MTNKELVLKIRRHVLTMCHDAHSSHVGSCLSCVDILAVLYNDIMSIAPQNPSLDDRDRFIMSKGHASASLYAVLAERGFFPTKDLETFYQNNGLSGHVSHHVLGVDASTGALGHGLSIACGIALAGKQDNKKYKVYTLLSDGDLNEGSTWEAVMFATQQKLDNLIVIVDYNQSQALGQSKDIIGFSRLGDIFKSFGCGTTDIDGHNLDEIKRALNNVPKVYENPTCIIAHTIKGKGVSFCENKTEWHYKSPNDEELKRALEELR